MHILAPKKQTRLQNIGYHWAGYLFLVLVFLRSKLQGYRNPRPFSVTEFRRVAQYDLTVLRRWLEIANEYTGENLSLRGRTVLELGPGPDLGIGVLTLLHGVKQYCALDVNDLAPQAPDEVYETLFELLREENLPEGQSLDTGFLRSQVDAIRKGLPSRINYVCRKDFDVTVFEGQGIDTVFSRAAFEHFDDVEKTISQLSSIAKPGCLLIAHVDMKTHSRWIRDKDPLNIYRYSDRLYDFLKVPETPNRLRPFEYKAILEKHGWTQIKIMPGTVVGEEYLNTVRKHLAERFQDEACRMECVSMFICAKKK